MPLITVTGYPSSGKTTRARQLKQLLQRYCVETVEKKDYQFNADSTFLDPMQRFFQPQYTAIENKIDVFDKQTLDTIEPCQIEYKHKKYDIVILNDETLNINVDLYENSYSEKQARGELLSAVEKHLSLNTIVICDGMNYIKGFRYQLYCVARALGTPCCVMHVATPVDKAKEWNTKYSTELLENLIYRYEEPISNNRWDSPLFTVVSSSCTYSIEMPLNTIDHYPLIQLCDFILNGDIKNPNLATVVKPVSDSNYLQLISKTTMSVVKDVSKLNNSAGTNIKLYPDLKVEFIMPLKISRPKLKELQKSFVKLRTLNGTNLSEIKDTDENKIKSLFIEFLNANLIHDYNED